jgi:hypothetical protein
MYCTVNKGFFKRLLIVYLKRWLKFLYKKVGIANMLKLQGKNIIVEKK